MLTEIAAAPDRPPADLRLTTSGQTHQLAVEHSCRSPGRDRLGEETGGLLHRRFEARAAHTPEAIAVLCEDAGGGQITYRELDRRSQRLARRLRGLGAGPEARVAILLDRTPAWPVAVLATLKAGGAYVPLDPADPGERLSFLLADSGTGLLLTRPRLAAKLADPGVALHLDRRGDCGPQPAGAARGEASTEVRGGNLAYVGKLYAPNPPTGLPDFQHRYSRRSTRRLAPTSAAAG